MFTSVLSQLLSKLVMQPIGERSLKVLQMKTLFRVITNGWSMGCIHYKMNQVLRVHT